MYYYVPGEMKHEDSVSYRARKGPVILMTLMPFFI